MKISKKNSKKNENSLPQLKSLSELTESQNSDIKGRSRIFKEINKTTKEHYDVKKKYEMLQKRVEFLKSQEQKIKREALNDQKREELKNKIIDERKKNKEYVQNYFKQKENEIKKQNLVIKEKYKEENKMLKSINEELSKKNRKKYDSLKNEKEKLEEKKKEKEKENIEQNKIKVNAIKKIEDKDKERNDKELIIDKNEKNKNNSETMSAVLSEQEKLNYLREKDLIKQEQQYLEKIEEAKKLTKNARSGSAGKFKVVVPKKNKNMKDKTKSSNKFGGKKEGTESIMMKYHKKLKENKKTGDKESNNIKKIDTNNI